MKTVILRADDICARTDLDALKRVYDPCWERGWPVCLAVIPHSAYQFSAEGIFPVEARSISEHTALVDFVADLAQAGLVEVLLHGWEHHWGELAGHNNVIRAQHAAPLQHPSIHEKLEAGLQVLREAWPNISVKVLVPPHDYLSREGLAAAKALGLQVCSTWAATHGGTGLAHWRGKLRHRMGWDFAPPQDSSWPTDITLLDFAGEAEGDWPETQQLLGLAARWSSPVVFVQHYWQLIDHKIVGERRASPLQSDMQKFQRWRDWLARMEQEDGIHFTRFCDLLGHHNHA